MRKYVYLASLVWLFSYPAFAADNAITVTNGADVNLKSKDVGSGVQLMQHGLLDTAGAEILGLVTASPAANTIGARLVTINTTLGTPLQAGGNLGTLTAVTGITNPVTVSTHAVTQSGNWTARIVGNAGGLIDAVAGAAVPANSLQIGMAQGGNLVTLTGTSGNLNVQCANCSGSGVSTADEATFTAGTSLFVGGGGFFQTTATSNALTNGQQGMQQMTAQRAGFVNLRNASGTEIGTTTTQLQVGAPSGAFASGSFASGSHASGSFASGAFASGSVASGALASGSIASGAMVDLGAQADSVCGSDTGTCSQIALIKRLNTLVNAAPPLGTSGGWTPKMLNALTNTAVAIKASAGQLGKLYCWNPNAAVTYVQVYNTASGSVTVGTTTPLQSYGIPPTNSSGYTLSLVGDQFGTAISAAATTTATGATAPSTAVDCNVSYN